MPLRGTTDDENGLGWMVVCRRGWECEVGPVWCPEPAPEVDPGTPEGTTDCGRDRRESA